MKVPVAHPVPVHIEKHIRKSFLFNFQKSIIVNYNYFDDTAYHVEKHVPYPDKHYVPVHHHDHHEEIHHHDEHDFSEHHHHF